MQAVDMPIWHAILLGGIEGVTEFLPISSTGHLTILEKLLGYEIDDPDVTAFTAIIQVGAVLATIVFLRKDIWRIATAWLRGIASPTARTEPDYRFGWAVILGSIPIGIGGLAFKDEIETTLRSLWFVGGDRRDPTERCRYPRAERESRCRSGRGVARAPQRG